MRKSTGITALLAAGTALLTACGDFGQVPSTPETDGETVIARLAVGTHTIVLAVTDDDGLTATDDVTVTVQAGARAGGTRAHTEPELRVNYGISGYSGREGLICSATCHLSPNGAVPSLTLQGPATLLPGEIGDYRLTLDPVEPTDQAGAGLDVAADGGTLIPVPGEETRMQDGELTHRSPRIGVDVITWDFRWQAPTVSGASHLFAAAVSANLKGRDSGDEVGSIPAFTVAVGAPPNQPPVARAGADRTVNDQENDGAESIVLDGSASTDVDGSIVAWEWSESGVPIGSGETAAVRLGLGEHRITLTVTDDAALGDQDEVIVTVAPAGMRPPLADAGADVTLVDADGNGMEIVVLDGSASQDYDGAIVAWSWSEDGKPLP